MLLFNITSLLNSLFPGHACTVWLHG